MTTGPTTAGFSDRTGPDNLTATQIDLSEVQRQFEMHLDDLLQEWSNVTAKQRDQIVDQVRAAVTSDDLAALAGLSVSTTEAAQLLTEAMTQMALDAAREVSREAADQGVRIDPVASDGSAFAAVAVALAVLLAEGLTNAAGREALRPRSVATTRAEVAAAVGEHLGSLSDAFVRDYLGGALTSAQNTGRLNTALSGPSAAVYASEWMDKATCKPCRAVNGMWLGNSDDPDIVANVSAVYPNGGFKDCLGGVRCRGTTVYVWRPEQVVRNHPGHADQKSHGRRRGLRSELAKAKTVEDVARIVSDHGSRLTGDKVTADFTGADVEVARQFGEGIIQGYERYPAAPLREIGTYGPGGSDTLNSRLANQSPRLGSAYAFALRGGESNDSAGGTYQVQVAKLRKGTTTTGTAIYLNVGITAKRWQDDYAARELGKKSRVRQARWDVGGTPRETALHEFGHAVAHHGRPAQPQYAVAVAAKTAAAKAGVDVKTYISRGVSRYATTNGAELAAEVFADVMANGSKASKTSRDLFAEFDLNAKGWEALVNHD